MNSHSELRQQLDEALRRFREREAAGFHTAETPDSAATADDVPPIRVEGYRAHLWRLSQAVKEKSEREAAERARKQRSPVNTAVLAEQIRAWWRSLPASECQARYRLVELRAVFQVSDHVLGNALRAAGWTRGRANGPHGTPTTRFWMPPSG